MIKNARRSGAPQLTSMALPSNDGNAMVVRILRCLFSTSWNVQDHHCDLCELPILEPTAMNYEVCYYPTLTQYHQQLHCVEVCSIFDAVEVTAGTHGSIVSRTNSRDIAPVATLLDRRCLAC